MSENTIIDIVNDKVEALKQEREQEQNPKVRIFPSNKEINNAISMLHNMTEQQPKKSFLDQVTEIADFVNDKDKVTAVASAFGEASIAVTKCTMDVIRVSIPSVIKLASVLKDIGDRFNPRLK